MNHEESKLQQACVAWFRAQYPQYAMLLTHPINEGSGHTQTDRRRQGIHKAEGAVAGVPDLILFLPNIVASKFRMPDGEERFKTTWYHGFGIEFKTKGGRQSQAQKEFERLFFAAGYDYEIIRSFEDFKESIENWMRYVPEECRVYVRDCYRDIIKEREAKEKEKFYKFVNKK